VDDSSSASLGIAFLLLAIYALINLAYAALANSRETTLQDDADEGQTLARQALRLLKNEARLTLTYQLTTMIAYAIAFIVLALGIVAPTLATIDLSGTLLMMVALGLGMVVFLLFGLVLPESIGSAHHTTALPISVFVFRALTFLLYPIVSALLILSRSLAGLFGASHHVNMVTEEEIMTLVNAGLTGGTIENEEKAMIYSILQLDETSARELMTPRPDIVALEMDVDIVEALHAFIDSGFSRIPVYEDNIDSVVGLLYAKDLLELWRNGNADETRGIRDLLRSPYFVPETKRADELLREMRLSKVHMAIVLDEYGGTSGLVTIENLIEEIVGDIVDEYDVEEEEYLQISDTEYIIDAGMDLDDLNDMLDIDLDAEETDTLGGFIYMSLGRVPIVGDLVDTEEVSLHVRSIDGRRIRNVALTLKQLPVERDENNKERNKDNSQNNDDGAVEGASAYQQESDQRPYDLPDDDKPPRLADAS
jgi:putative hemolysin